MTSVAVGGLTRHDDELVAAQTGKRVPRPQTPAKPRRDLPQQLVSHGVAERVVDDLEPVQIEHDQRHPIAAPPRAGDRLA